MFYRVLNIAVNIVDPIVHQCFNGIFVFMWKFVQLNPMICQHRILIMSHLRSLLVRTQLIFILTLSLFLVGQARRFKKLCEEIQILFLTSKDRLAKQRRQTNDTRPMTSTAAAATTTANRPNISFISSLFGTTNSSCKKITEPLEEHFLSFLVYSQEIHLDNLSFLLSMFIDVKMSMLFYLDGKSNTSQQQSSSSSASSLSSTSNVSLTNPLVAINDNSNSTTTSTTTTTVESARVKLANRLAI